MNLYPFNNPIVLTDVLFMAYGGHGAIGSSAQKAAAYLIAEMAVTEDLSTLLLPTTVTGTFSYSPTILTDYAYVNYLSKVTFLDFDKEEYWSQSGASNVYYALRDDTYGIVDIDYLSGNCGCHNSGEHPYQVQIVYNCGLHSGTSFRADILLALTTYADIILNEIIGYGNEAPGDIGVQDFQNQQYRESRVRLFRTSFGSSPRAHFASNLLQKYRKPRYVGI
jgi:hypothetical protein